MTQSPSSGLAAAADAVELAQHLVDSGCAAVRANGGVDANQVVAYDLAHAAAAVATARASLYLRRPRRDRGAPGHRVRGRRAGRPDRPGGGREAAWGVEAGWSAPAADFLAARRDPAALAALAQRRGTAPPRQRLRAGARDVPPLRRGEGAPARRARPPHQRRHPRGDHHRPGRAGRLRAVGPRGVRRLRHRRGERLHGHGRRHRGVELGLAGHRRLADHPARDPHPGPGLRRHRGAEEAVAAQAGLGRGAGRGGGDRARLRLRRRRHRHLGHPDRRGMADQRGQDLVHLRRPGRRAHAAGPHRPGPLPGASWALHVRGREAPRRRPRLRVHPGRRRAAGRSGSGRLEGRPIDTIGYRGHALLRAVLRGLVRPRRQPGRRTRRPGQGLLPPDAGLRERPAADRGPCPRGHAGGLRSRLRPTPPIARCSGRRSATTN